MSHLQQSPSPNFEVMIEQGTDEEDELDPTTIIRGLYKNTFQGEWEEVVKLYEAKPEVWSTEITSSGDTALHMAINEVKEEVVERLVDIIVNADDSQHKEKKVEALVKANDVGDTPLHRASARGSVTMCRCIVKAATRVGKDLLGIRNNWGENPMFVAVLDNCKHAFIYFFFDASHKVVEDSKLLTPTTGDTVLHIAIRREHYDLAFQILQLCPHLMTKYNQEGMTPLHILASKPSAFKSGSHLSWWQSIIYYCIRVDPLEYETSLPERSLPTRSSELYQYPENYRTCSFRRCGGSVMSKRDPENHYVKGNVPQNCATWFQFLFMLLQTIFGFLGFGKTFEDIIKARQKHKWSVQILDEMMKDPGKTYMSKGGTDPGPLDFLESDNSPFTLPSEMRRDIDMAGNKTKNDEAPKRNSTALLVAAQKGVLEVVDKILEQLPVSIHDTSSNKKNIVLVAVENRQPGILQALKKHLIEVSKKPQLWEGLIQSVDVDDNSVLHLAAKYDESKSHPWQFHGKAMQMQWEIKWYEHVKSFVPPHFDFLTNKQGKTPVQVFTEEHKTLLEDSSAWLKETSESCSVVAALVAGVSFATSSQVPGGTDDKTGRPKLQGEPEFDLFAVTAVIGLCFSVTALIMFLSILTSRNQHRDFRRNLPMKLLLGLTSLFVSIASMLISFCAAYFFIIEERFKKGVFPLYAATCLPVSFYAIAQFPLYAALFKAIARRVPEPHYSGHL